MKKLLKSIFVLFVFVSAQANAFDFRIGPKVGIGIGAPTGISGTDAKVAVGFPIGVLSQFDFGAVGIDLGLNYRYSIFGFSFKEDNDGDTVKDTNTTAIGYSSVEIPVTVYYKLRREHGFFKFGGGLGLDMGFGKVKYAYEEDNSTNPDVDTSSSVSFSDAGLKQLDVYLIAHFGYEFLFEKWALSVDFQPKYGLVDKFKSGTNENPDGDKWHTLWFDLSVAFLF
ncbi:MAG: outer membrane beta-barrel protein [Bdellovibrionota bacterium]